MEIITLIILGLIASFAGTVVMTISQEIEIKIRKRPISYTPAIAVFNILRIDFEPVPIKMKGVLSYLVHFGYGTFWGFLPSLLYLFDVTKFSYLFITFFMVVWIQGLVVIPLLKIAGPPWTWGIKSIAIEIFHKFIYSFGTIYTFLFLVEKFL